MAAKEQPIRLQVPVPAHVAEEIAERAEAQERSVAWLSDKLLEFMVEDRQRLVDWYTMALLGRTYSAAKQIITGKKRRKTADDSEIRMQISVSPELLKQIESIAEDTRETSVRTAGKLLEAGLLHHQMFLDFLATNVGKSTAKAFGSPRGSNRSNSEKHFPCFA